MFLSSQQPLEAGPTILGGPSSGLKLETTSTPKQRRENPNSCSEDRIAGSRETAKSMVVSSQRHKSKKQKVNGEHDIDGSNNNIDNLPDTILQHILSFLPTKDAIGTSILSKGWRYLWTSIPNLVFEQGLPANRRPFMNFVESVLILRDFSNVEKFSLRCDVLYDASRISAWISAAVKRKVQNIDICLDNFEEPFVLPHCLFTCDSLKTLRLDMGHILKLPPSIGFSSLKSLVLWSVTFSDNYSTQQLFSGCPVLEHLWILNCIWENLEVVCIAAPKLRELTIDEFTYYDEDLSDVNGCGVIIFGTSLKTFHYTGKLVNDYCLYDSPSLDVAHIEVSPSDWNTRDGAYRVSKLLEGVVHVNDLIISSGALEFLDDEEELFAHLPMFNNLTDLQLILRSIHFDCKALHKILQNSPRLESLVFDEGVRLSTSFVKDDRLLDPVPPCFLSHLKCIKVYNFDGNKDQLYVMKILLKNATVLDKMVITSRVHVGRLGLKKKVRKQLLKLPRGSMSCTVVFCEEISLF